MERISQTLQGLISRVASESLDLINGIMSSEPIRRPSQIVCSGCRSLLIFPAGAPTVLCGACNTVMTVYPQGGGMDQIVCAGCRTPLMYNRGATSVQCACCQTVTSVATENNALVNCGQCNTTLMFPHGAQSVRCSRCNYITNITSGAGLTPIAGPRPTDITQGPPTTTQASPQTNNVTVVVENPMTVDGDGKLVSNVAVGITSGKK
ncbi:protein LOL2-like isoform X2 [Carex rostrata]